METLNKTCLQVPKPQTLRKIQKRGRPHVNCSPKHLQWLLREEAKIDKRYNKAG